MVDLRLRIEADQKTGLVDEDERVSNWIRDIDDRGCDEGVAELGDNKVVAPATPTRQPTPLLYYEDVSPTNASFAGGSVFDTPQTPRTPWSDDSFCDDASIATSVSYKHEHLDCEPKEHCQTVLLEEHTVSRPCSVVSVDPPSELDKGLEDELGDFLETDIAAPWPGVEPDQPRIVRLVSCLQCTLAGLPCSRSVPACSRCQRAGKPEICLLYRQRFREEIRRSDGETCTSLVLLKLKNEDPASWQLKLSVKEELHAARLAKQDHDNWVLPPVCSPRGNFKRSSVHTLSNRPGERSGDWVHRELHVDMES